MMVGAYSSLEGAQRTLMEALVASYLIKVLYWSQNNLSFFFKWHILIVS